jgi:hypothetical protein
MHQIAKAFLLLGLFHSFGPLSAQLPTVDVTSVVMPANEVEVRIRPDAAFNGVFSSIVFTLRWDAAAGNSLGDVLQNVPQIQYCTVSKSGPEQVDGPYRYQIFVGFGSIPMTSLSTFWQADQEVVLCRIPITGPPGLVALVDDDWSAANNGNYYVSLNGEDRTGIIYSITTTQGVGSAVANGIAVYPNPAQGLIFVALATTEQGPARFELIDASGRIIPIPSTSGGAGAGTQVLDLGSVPNGAYQLVMFTAGASRTELIVIQR